MSPAVLLLQIRQQPRFSPSPREQHMAETQAAQHSLKSQLGGSSSSWGYPQVAGWLKKVENPIDRKIKMDENWGYPHLITSFNHHQSLLTTINHH